MLSYSLLKVKLPMEWTILQLQEEAKKYIGKEVIIESTVIVELFATHSNTQNYHVNLETGHISGIDDNSYLLEKDQYTHIVSEIPEINSKLKQLSKGDKIKAIVQLDNISFGYQHEFFFKLLSFERLKEVPPALTQNDRDYMYLIYGIIAFLLFVFFLYSLFTETKNGYWFHDTIGLVSIKVAVFLFFFMSSFFVYAFIKRI